ncbi:MAG: hypothetical protein ACLVD1_10000 [Lacrimispora saccharolytica]|nr:MAG TPA: Protein of unknown function (DUF1617) [Caudoviricetes sp.]
MKITNRQVIEFINSVSANKLASKRLPVKVAYAISRNLDKMNNIITSYETARKTLLDQYAEKDEEGKAKVKDGNYVIQEDQKQAFSDEMKELLEVENEIDLHTINMDEVEKCDTDKYDSLTTADLMTLDIMIN